MPNQGLSGFQILLALARILVARKIMILGITGIGTVAAIITVLVVSSTYRSVAIVKPPSPDGMGTMQVESALKDMGGPLSGMLGSFLGGESGEDDCVSILTSTQFALAVIDRFKLDSVYKFTKREKYYQADVLKKFRKNAGHSVTDEGAIKIVAEDRSPERAQAMVEYMIALLDSLYTDIQKKSINQKFAYIDKRVALAEAEMRTLEDSLGQFQLRHNLYLPELQVKSTLELVTKLEIQLELLKQDMDLEAALRGRKTARYHDLTVEKRLLERKLRDRFAGSVDSSSLVMPVHVVPSLATDYYRLERDYNVKLALYKFLIQQLESLRLESQKNIKVVSVIDPPWTSDKRVAPKRRLVVQMVFALLLILTSGLAIVLAFWEKQKRENSAIYGGIMDLKRGLFKFR